MKTIYIIFTSLLIFIACSHDIKRDPKKVSPKNIGETIDEVMIRNLS